MMNLPNAAPEPNDHDLRSKDFYLEGDQKKIRLEYLLQMTAELRKLALPLNEALIVYMLEMLYSEIYMLHGQMQSDEMLDQQAMELDLLSEKSENF